jgi:hypothetical protein
VRDGYSFHSSRDEEAIDPNLTWAEDYILIQWHSLSCTFVHVSKLLFPLMFCKYKNLIRWNALKKCFI